MFTTIFLTLLFTPLSAQILTAAEQLKDCDGVPRVVVLRSVDGDEQHVTVRATANAGDAEPAKVRKVIVVKDAGEQTSQVWIGVRLMPVPAPLAAHIGERGVMIGNVVQDSPADKAGLQRYDVVVGFANHDVNQPQELVAAVEKAGPDQAVKLTVIRKGQPQELEITPVKRPAGDELKLKYDEPEEGLMDDAIKLRGLTLKHGPNGQWMFRDLGPMKNMPDALKELEEKLELQVVPDLPELPDVPSLDDDEDTPAAKEGTGSSAAEEQRKIEVRVRVEDDGQSTTVLRETDGKIQVTRRSADGQESSATYDHPEALRKADPQAYKLYHQHDGGSSSKLFQWYAPNAAHESLRREFQVDVEKKVKEALARAREARGRAPLSHEEALERALEAERRAQRPGNERIAETRRVKIRSHDAAASQAQSEKLLVRLHDDGALTVIVAKEGGKVTHEFKSKEAFQTAEPELYEQVKGLLE